LPKVVKLLTDPHSVCNLHLVVLRVRRNSHNRGSRDLHDFGSLLRFLTNAVILQRGREFLGLSKN